MRTVYGWNDPAFDGSLLLQRIHQLLFAAALPATFVPASGATPAALNSCCSPCNRAWDRRPARWS